MHEGAVCREIVDIVTEAAAVNDIIKVYEIVVSVGEYSCVNESQLNFYFDIMKTGYNNKITILGISKIL